MYVVGVGPLVLKTSLHHITLAKSHVIDALCMYVGVVKGGGAGGGRERGRERERKPQVGAEFGFEVGVG